MMFLTIFLLLSLQNTHLLIVDASFDAVKDNKVTSLQQLYSLDKSRDRTQNQIEKVSGEDENEQKEALIVKKFRDFLGLKTFRTTSPSSEDTHEYVSPSPSPSPPAIDTEAPAPVLPLHAHSHHPPPRSSPTPKNHKIQNDSTDKVRARRILIPALLSSGAFFAVCILGLICFCVRFKKNHKKSKKMVSVYRKKRSNNRGKSLNVNPQNSSSKVSLNPGLDLFYLNSLDMDLEQQQPTPCFKENPVIENPLSNHGTPNHRLPEKEEPNQESIRSESDNGSSPCTREIVSVDEDADSVKHESDDVGDSIYGDKIIPIDGLSSDNESFHSFYDSHSSGIRLSDASAGSLSDRSEVCSPIVPKKSPSPLSSLTNLPLPQATPDHISTSASNSQTHTLQSPYNKNGDNVTVNCSLDCQKKFALPPPPPPPPPPLAPNLRIFPSHSTSCSTRLTSQAPCSSTLRISSPPKNSHFSGGSIQDPLRKLPSPPQQLSKPSQTAPVIPPPPFPPPFRKGGSNYSKGPPPPPPSQIPQYTPLGKDGAPLPKLKPLHWDKVRAAPDRSMVWDKLKSSSFEFDEEMIESLFGYNIQNSMKNEEAKSNSPSPSKHVLEPKRLQNITILSKALNVTPEQVCDALIKGEGLCLQQLEALVKMVPTKDEEAKLCGYKGDTEKLGSAEKFVKAILGIPFAFLRAEAMLYRETFEDEMVHLRNSYTMLEEACKELRSSRLFLKLLEAVLKTGNRMNVGTLRGGARAFKLDALLKLADVKGTDGKTTLLHFVVQEIIRAEGIRVSDSIMGKINQRNKSKTPEEREEDYRRMGLDLVSGLSTELYNVKKTATIDIDVLGSSVSNLSQGMAKLQHLVHKDLCDEKSVNFVHSMKPFMIYADKSLKELQQDESRVLLHVREITEYFHGDVSKEEANPLRIFVIVRDFLGMLDHVCKELRSFKVPSSPNPLAPFR
ncbi:FH2 domain-containing protein [Cephalotus follicularis]|uniref:Formin-like protein n=1 Tax=Cephalotus follicularis TaxID=3775 RepID=A0A1Q3CUL9_CEPFO|nr:FH2 domain-containing protein [Cephalotus follicularis]